MQQNWHGHKLARSSVSDALTKTFTVVLCRCRILTSFFLFLNPAVTIFHSLVGDVAVLVKFHRVIFVCVATVFFCVTLTLMISRIFTRASFIAFYIDCVCMWVCAVVFPQTTATKTPYLDPTGAMVIVWRLRGKIIRSVLCNIVRNNCAQCNAHIWTDLTVLGNGFCLTGPISLGLDSFLYMYYCMHV